MDDFEKVVSPGYVDIGPRSVRVFCKISFHGGRLSITGVEGPKKNGDCWGACGQIGMHQPNMTDYAPGWDGAMVRKFWDRWGRWHLNDMRAGCEHQQDIIEAEGPRGAGTLKMDYAVLILDPRFKSCPACGYAYGSNWKKVEVPADVIEFLRGLPDTDVVPAWV